MDLYQIYYCIPFLVALLAQFIKIIIDSFSGKHITFRSMLVSGGMPSAHSTLTSSVPVSYTHLISASLAKGKEVRIQGFGTFKVSKRAARNGVNPRTGESIKIKAMNVASFKAGKELKAQVNK